MSNHQHPGIDAQWFRASEATGDFMGIRYGRGSPGSDEVEWSYLSHCECDGMGGFVRLLREHGAAITTLPKTKHPCRGIIAPLWKLWRNRHSHPESAQRPDWSQAPDSPPGPSPEVAWHLFTEEETKALLKKCRDEGVTVNSFLLKHLDQAIRPGIQKPQAAIPWMIPINLRGDLQHDDETRNHVSFLELRIQPGDSAKMIQTQLQQGLQRGEHRANYLILALGRFLTHKAKIKVIQKDRAKPAGNIGTFSNLGVWDPEKSIGTRDSWLFCPPVVKGQLLGAGALTFQGKLALAIQGHPNPATPGISKTWMKRWLAGIR
ncbi:hypothetical protein V2O64_04905 [Verrucomicrobiaceae bacterium 227]